MSNNGHPNWATWNVALWLGNDKGLYWQYKRLAQSVFEAAAYDEGIGTTQFAFLDGEETNDFGNTFEEAVAEASKEATKKIAVALEESGIDYWIGITDLTKGEEFRLVDWEDVAEGILEEAGFQTDGEVEVTWAFSTKEEIL